MTQLTRSASTSLVRWLLGEALPAAGVYVRLSTTVPAIDGTGWTEVPATGFGGYVPAAIAGAMSTPNDGRAENVAPVSLGTPTTGGAVLAAWGLWDAPVGGTLRAFLPIAPGLPVVAGREVRFNPATLRVEVL